MDKYFLHIRFYFSEEGVFSLSKTELKAFEQSEEKKMISNATPTHIEASAMLNMYWKNSYSFPPIPGTHDGQVKEKNGK